jgi:hypothetical protein
MCFYYDEQPKLAEARQVKCRKDHPCEGCCKTIKKGQRAEHNTGLFDGSWYSYYVCDRCQRVIMGIAAKELLDGCPWHTAWCSPCDLYEYVNELEYHEGEEIRPLGLRTLEDCMRYVDQIAVRTGQHWWLEEKMILLESF